jgi:hypothetical protein
VEFIDNGLAVSMGVFEKRFPDTLGIMGMNIVRGINAKGASVSDYNHVVIGKKATDVFPDRNCFCPDYEVHCGDPEMKKAAIAINVWQKSPERIILFHHWYLHNDIAHKVVSEIDTKDKEIRELRQKSGYLWGKNFNLIKKELNAIPTLDYNPL